MNQDLKFKASLGVILLIICITISCKENKSKESHAGEYDLPELLVNEDGTRIRTAEQWQSGRRREVLGMFREHVYGKIPGNDPEIHYLLVRSNEQALGGRAIMKEVMMQVAYQGDTLNASMLLFLPRDTDTPVPVFLGLNFNGNHTIHSDPGISITESWVRNNADLNITDHRATEKSRGSSASRWPVDLILERGYGMATIYYGDLDPDFDDGFGNGIHGVLGPAIRDSSSWGSISAWAWGLSRAMDYFDNDPDIDQNRIALLGHSRLGKTALWAAALDQRFALVISNDSGCGGAALSRRKSGERLSDINTNFPHWFAKKFHAYNGREEDLPVDQHMLLALMAPRPVYVASAANDDWADPTGEYLSLYYAGEVYQLFGYETLESSERPEVENPVQADRQAYHIRSGNHDVTLYDWERFLDFADRQFDNQE